MRPQLAVDAAIGLVERPQRLARHRLTWRWRLRVGRVEGFIAHRHFKPMAANRGNPTSGSCCDDSRGIGNRGQPIVVGSILTRPDKEATDHGTLIPKT